MKYKMIRSKAVCMTVIVCMLLSILPSFATQPKEEQPSMIPVVMVIEDVKPGRRITDKNVKLTNVPNYNLPSNVILNYSSVINKYAAVALYAGEYLYTDQLTDTSKIYKEEEPADLCENSDFVVATDFIIPNSGNDVTELIQGLIDANPGRTIHFPDGEYLVSSTIMTSAAPADSVSLHLSDGAVIKAASYWESNSEYGNAIISLGAAGMSNNVKEVGSYYSVIGGTLDGNRRANGLSVYSGRETLVRDVCIVNVKEGIIASTASSSGGMDCDFEDITVIGSDEAESRGVVVIGSNGTFTNIRVYDMEVGFDIYSSGMYKDLFVYNEKITDTERYANTIGIRVRKYGGAVLLSRCTVENYATAYVLDRNTVLLDSVARWTYESCNVQTAVEAGSGTPSICGVVAEFYGEEATTAFYKSTAETAKPVIWGCAFDESLVDDKGYESFIYTPIMSIE